MPWMLLTEPPDERRSARRGHDGESDDDHDIGLREGEVWIMVGGLDRALLQAGMVGRLLETGAPPAAIIASGFALANAVLVAGARTESFDRRWEQLRAHRFLVSAALGSVRLFGALNGVFDDLVALLGDTVQGRKSRAGSGPEILVASEDGFSKLEHDCTTASWRGALKRSLRYTNESAPLVAGAICEASVSGGPILVLGLERTMQSHPDVEAACRAAAADGARVRFLTAAVPPRTGLLGYLLPGSGAPERLMNEGRQAAERWIDGMSANGSRRTGQGQAPPAAPGSSDGDALSEPDGTGGLWTSDASDPSNWLK
jgi:hypothetical protein